MLGWCIVTLASARLKASIRFPPLRRMYQRGGTCKGCDTTIRDQPEEWTAGVWREVYNFLPERGGMANRTDKYVEGKFLHEVDLKDGFPVRECRDARERRLLEFLVPIVHPDKSTRVAHTLENTIFGAISRERSVDWSVIFMELVNRLVGGAGKTKPTPICSFLYDLYESKGLLTEGEETDYRAAEELTRYRITPDWDPDSDSEVLRITGLEPPQVVAPMNQGKRGNKRKQTYRAPDGSLPIRSRGEGSRPTSESNQLEGVCLECPRLRSPPLENPQLDPRLEPQQLEQPKEEEKPWIKKPFNAVVESYRRVKAQYQCLERMMEDISLYVDMEPRDMLDHI